MKRSVKYSPSNSETPALHDAPGPVAPDSAMVRTQLYLSRDEYDFVQAEATRRGEPMAAFIRTLIDEKMQMPDDVWTRNPMLRPTPVEPGWDSPADAAINHDHYLAGAPKKWLKVKGQWTEAPPVPKDYYDSDASYRAYNQKLRTLESGR